MTSFAAVLFALSVFAEIAPEHYEEMRRHAPEVLQIEVTSVSVNRDLQRYCPPFDWEVARHVTVHARVIAVVRSSSDAKVGDTIRIDYTTTDFCDGWVGPGQLPILKKGEKVFAYLKKGGRGFGPAAMGRSFAGDAKVELR